MLATWGSSSGINALLASSSLSLNFSNGSYTLGGVPYAVASVPGYSFTRASGGYAETVAGDLTWFTGTRTNVVLQSQRLGDASVWNNSAITIALNSTVAPDGTTTASLWTPTTASVRHYSYAFASSFAANTTYTFSVYAKTAGYTTIGLGYNTGSGDSFIGGAISISTGTSVGNGWYRISRNFTTPASPTYILAEISVGNPNGFVGDGTSGLYLWGAQLETATDTRITYPTAYIPTTTAAVSVDTPRITNKGYLSEEARTNLVTYSQDLTNAAWAKNAVTALANQTTSPDGTVTASSMTETTATAQHYTSYATAKAASAITYSVSVYVKQFGLTRNLKFGLFDGAGNGVDTIINPVTLAVVSGPTYYGALPFTSVSVTTSTSSNGFVRIGLIFTSNVTPVVGFGIQTAIGTGLSFAGDASTGFYVWGAQLEAGAFATSYIPTTTAAATRAADVLRYSGISFVSSSFTLAATGNYNQIHTGSASSVLASLSNNTISNVAYIDVEDGFNRLGFIVKSGGSVILNALPAYTPPPLSLKTALRVDASTTMRGAFNGTLSGSATGANPIGMNSLSVGIADWANGAQFNGYIQNATIYPTALTDAQLQAITA